MFVAGHSLAGFGPGVRRWIGGARVWGFHASVEASPEVDGSGEDDEDGGDQDAGEEDGFGRLSWRLRVLGRLCGRGCRCVGGGWLAWMGGVIGDGPLRLHRCSIPARVVCMDENTLHFQGHASVADDLEARILTIRDSL